jgi:hypothetical protein
MKKRLARSSADSTHGDAILLGRRLAIVPAKHASWASALATLRARAPRRRRDF